MPKKQPKPDDVKIGANLRRIRMLQGRSQEWLGDQVKLTFQQIQKYEKGTNRIGGSRLMEFCRVLNVTPDQLLAGIQQTNTPAAPDVTTRQFETHAGIDLAVAWDKLAGLPAMQRRIVALVEAIAEHATR